MPPRGTHPTPPVAHFVCGKTRRKELVREFGVKVRDIGVKIRDWTGKGKNRKRTKKRRRKDDTVDSKTVAF